MTKFSEGDLVIESLKIIKSYPQGIETKDLLQILRLALDPSGEDLEVLSGRSDDKFSQKVRNLKSHKTLENKGFAKFLENRFYITDDGINFINDNSHLMGDFELKTLSINILNDWPLSVRTSNALKNENIIFVGDLLLHDRNKLLSITNFGRKSLNELEELMKENNINWNSVEANTPQWFDKREVLLDAIKMKKDKGAYLESNTKGLKSLFENFDNVSNILNTDKIYIDTNISPTKLEELIISDIDEILSLLSDKMAFIFKSRFAYKENYKTLEELGKKFEITRERVRQLEFKLKRNLKTFGKIEKASLINYFDKHETVSFHKLFPKLNKYFTNTRFGSMDITKDKLAIFMESFCGVKEEYFKTPEREFQYFDSEQLKEIFLFTSSGVTTNNFIEIIKDNYGYNDFNSKMSLEFMNKKEFIKIVDGKVYPIKINKVEEVSHILLDFPKGLHWRNVCKIGNKSFTKNKWDLERLGADSSFNMLHNPNIYLIDKGKHRLVKYLLLEIKNIDLLILKTIDLLNDLNLEQSDLEKIYKEIIKIKEYNDLNFYDLRGIIKIFGEANGLYHTGRSGQNTISLNKVIKTVSLKDKIKEIIESSNGEIKYQEINERLQKLNEQLPLSIHLDKLEDENIIFKINPGTYLNFNEAIQLCDQKEVEEYLNKILDKYEFITNVFIREKINDDLGYNLSTSYYTSLVKFLAKKNNWFYEVNYFSKKHEKILTLDGYIIKNYEKGLSTNENFLKFSKIIGISKTYFYNTVSINKLNFNTDWIHADD